MASLLASLLIKLGLDSADLRSGLSDAERDVRTASQRIAAIGNAMVSTGQKLTMAVTLPMMALGGMAVQGALEQRAAIAQVETAIASMGNVAGRTAEQLAKNADALEMNSLVDADVILTKVTANLLTFGNVAGEVFDRAQQAVLDISQRLGTDLTSATVMVGKALNDPINGLGALGKTGALTKEWIAANKEMIKGLVQTGQTAKAQDMILRALEKQYRGAAQAAAETSPWRQATVAINQTADAFGEALLPILPAVSDLIVGVAQAFGNLSPTMQQTLLVAAAVAAAFGPILVGIGSVTVALATRLGPALAAAQVAFWRLVAAQNATSAASIALSIALRGLLIATGVGAVIAGLAAAYYLLTNRSNEATAAQHAKALQSIRTAAAADIERKATAELTAARGKERVATLAAMQASRARGLQALQTAKALQVESRAALAATREKIQSDYLKERGGSGNVGKVDLADTRARLRGAAVSTAETKLRDADKKIAKLEGDLAGLDKAIDQATAPISMPTINTGGLDAGSAAAGRASRAVGELGKSARDAKQAADELQSVMDRLFPEVAKQREFEKQLKLIEQSKMAEEQRVAAVEALRREYAGLHRDLAGALPGDDATKIELAAGGETIEQMSQRIDDRFGDVMENLSKKAGATKVQVVKSMQDMVTDMMSAFDRLASSIRGGGFLDILQSVIGVGLKLGDAGLFGKSFQTQLQKIPGNANGTNNWRGGWSFVGERGPELLNLPRGSQVKTNRELNAMMRNSGRERSVVEIVDTTDLFRFRVNGQIVEASPAIMDGSARVTTSRAVRKQQRRL